MGIDKTLLKLPLIGILLRKIAVARFTRTLGTLISSGVPILEGLDITARTAGNAVIEKALLQVRKALEAGRNLADPLTESGVFPGMVTQMIGVGEQTGAMDAMLQKIADFYEDEVDSAVKDLLSAMEPAMIVFLGSCGWRNRDFDVFAAVLVDRTTQQRPLNRCGQRSESPRSDSYASNGLDTKCRCVARLAFACPFLSDYASVGSGAGIREDQPA